jgi:tRNA-splicing ligase RtcB
MQLEGNIAIFGSHDENTLIQIRTSVANPNVVKGVLCADGHKGYAVPIGGVVAYRDAISPSGVGFDIACGNKAVLTDAPADEVRANIKTIMDDIWNIISFGVGRKNNETVEHPLFDRDDDRPGWSIPFVKSLKRMAQDQLGTVGSGNHYVDIFVDEEDRVWIGVHFGSRGFGHRIATHFLQAAGAKDGMDVEPCVISTSTDLGQDYLAAMNLAGDYAYAGRDWVCNRVAKILGANILSEVHNHHNFAWSEVHDDERLWVVRKGATPARPGQKGFVGGSMGEISVILEGVESELGRHSLYSTVHGAGRVMGRLEAKGKYKKGVCVREGRVKPDEMQRWIQEEGVELRGAGLDEAPQCYKRLPDVLRAHGETIKILHTLKPLGVAMAGPDIRDPYQD